MVKRVALCFSGHIRDFHLCSQSLQTNFIQPFQAAGFEVDVFGMFWNVLGHRSQGWNGMPNFEYFKQTLQPKVLIAENFDRIGFATKYYTEQWKTRQHLSCNTTSGDAASMWYITWRCFQEIESYQSNNAFTYDVICRVRPDLIYDTPLNITEIDDIMNHDVVYIPKWRGKYYEVCREIVDYFGMGNYKVMKRYLSTFENIGTYISSNDYIHTAEGFLLAQLQGYETKRTNIQFSVQRAGYIENVMC